MSIKASFLNSVVRMQLKEITNEMMYQLAAVLPERYRGAFSDFSQATTTYLRFVEE